MELHHQINPPKLKSVSKTTVRLEPEVFPAINLMSGYQEGISNR